MNKPVVGFIVGPTACGKTALSLNAAKKMNAEIISADSIQIYKELNIGSAKPSLTERGETVHHLMDFLAPMESFSVADFQRLAFEKINDIVSRGKFPLVVGGTGLYINSLTYPLCFSDATTDPKLREELNKLDSHELHAMLANKDENAAKRLHPNDKKRIVRALEIIELTENGTVPDDFSNSKNDDIAIEPRMLGISIPRTLLYERINRRVDIMMEQGLLKEVTMLLKNGCDAQTQSMQGLGYKQLIKYIQGEYTLDEAVEAIKIETRHFAKRQLTWFRRDQRISWLDITTNDDIVSQAVKVFEGENQQ